MPKAAKPFSQIAKRIASLQAKCKAINDEMAVLADLVATEVKKSEAAVPATPAKSAAAKTTGAKAAPKKAGAPKAAPTTAPKKRGRPPKK